jgi:DNA-binding transcriptional LysR family regulator
MKLQGLRALVAIVDHGSFSEAALELGVSQSTVSHAIAELEEELGVRLLERGRFGAVPTPVGERVAAHARDVEAALAAIGQEASSHREELRGELRVSAIRSLAVHVLAPVMRSLRDTHPDLKVTVREVASWAREPLSHLRSARVDVALTMSVLAEDVLFWDLFVDPYVAVVPQDSRFSDGPVTLRDVIKEPVILNNGPCSWPMRSALLNLDPGFRPAHEIAEDSTMVALVARGLGVALMPALTVDSLPGTRTLPLADQVDRRLGVAVLPKAMKTPAVRVFLERLREMFPDCAVPPLRAPGGASPHADEVGDGQLVQRPADDLDRAQVLGDVQVLGGRVV